MTYKYDQFGNRTALDVVEGSTTLYDFDYNYDGAGRITQIADGILSGATIRIEFYDSGRMKKIRHFNGSWTDFSYSETTGQLTEVAHLKSGPTSIIDFQYAYNARNDITEKLITTTGAVDTEYAYDLKNQLTQVNVDSTTTESYTYDSVGNRTASGTNTWTYNNGNQLEEYESYDFTYDNNGNMITYQNANKTLEYSVDDRLMKYKESGTTKGEYRYDVDGLRVAKMAGDITIYFMYDGTVLLAEVTKDGSTVTDDRYYTFMPGSYYPLAMVVFESGTPHAYDIHNDHLMTPQVLTSAGSTVVWQASYKAFGEANITTNTVKNSIRFPGQYNDIETGWYFNLNRYYISQLGRYNRVDPYFDMHLFQFPYINKRNIYKNDKYYNYVTNNPILLIDPLGLRKCDSGLCPDCKSGYWIGAFGDASAGFGVGVIAAGGSCSLTPLICTSENHPVVLSFTCCFKFGVGTPWAGVGGGVIGCAGAECIEDFSGLGGGGSGSVKIGIGVTGGVIASSNYLCGFVGLGAGLGAYFTIDICYTWILLP